jgi:hypothetical protein
VPTCCTLDQQNTCSNVDALSLPDPPIDGITVPKTLEVSLSIIHSFQAALPYKGRWFRVPKANVNYDEGWVHERGCPLLKVKCYSIWEQSTRRYCVQRVYLKRVGLSTDHILLGLLSFTQQFCGRLIVYWHKTPSTWYSVVKISPVSGHGRTVRFIVTFYAKLVYVCGVWWQGM